MMADPSAGSGAAASRARWPVTASFEMYTCTSSTTSVPVTRSPGFLPPSTSGPALKAIVMPGMKPLMSSCFIVTSPRSGAMA